MECSWEYTKRTRRPQKKVFSLIKMGFYNRRPQQALTDVKITSVYIISDVMFTSKCYHMMYQNLEKVLDYAGFCSWVIRDPPGPSTSYVLSLIKYKNILQPRRIGVLVIISAYLA